ncbi:MAG TPA: LytTR family transcriptional regulator DNA-binding domain-containing protein [Cytophagaceae bacterium]|jgi:two-component system LytT family response regulator|nr:LytTR family transcriptional regulator DNA-binding domain-containing protein [Cytophagaceae bacterium]
MTTIKTIIIEDEQLARELIKNYLSEYSSIELIAECEDGFQGMKAIQELQPDLIFLDVQMPKLTGFEMLELLENPPLVIFTTAFNEYAIKAFEMNAADYLLKPFSRERFDKAVEKTRKRMGVKETEKLKELIANVQITEKVERIVVKTGTKIQVIPIDSIVYMEAQDDYVMLYTAEGKFLKQQTMKHYESALDGNVFVRVHRSYMVNIHQVVRIEPYEKESFQVVLKNNIKLPVSKSGYSLLKKTLDF